jgi:ATP-dependent helicase/nuclease subunit B
VFIIFQDKPAKKGIFVSVRFILGRSGTGKTSYCIQSIVNELAGESDQPLVLLVPEQASYQAERAILSAGRIEGYHRLNVLSFDRLQFLLLGKNTARPSLSRIGRQMVIHRILCENIKKLKILNNPVVSPGLSQQIAQTIAELHQYAKTPEDIDCLIERLGKEKDKQLTALKFADIGLILKEYIKFVTDDFFDADIQFKTACAAVGNADFVKGAKIWVDGFAGFNDSELGILTELLKVSRDSYIALCLDGLAINPANPDKHQLNPASLFYPTEQTYCNLVEIIRKNKLQQAEPLLLNKAVRFSGSLELAHIEKYIFTHKAPQAKSSGNIGVYSAPNHRAEARFVARRILELVKTGDCRYRDIAVIASNIERYRDYLTAYFSDYNIPFFIDTRKPLNRHPVARLISSAIQAATGNFSNNNIFTYLKTDLVPVERYEIDLLENYCIAFGISPDDWQSDKIWQFAVKNEDFDQERINRIRRKVITPLLELRQRLVKSETIFAEQLIQAIFDFLNTLKVRETLGKWIGQAHNNNDMASADEHLQFYNKLIDILDELVDVFAGRSSKIEDYCAIINSAFSQMTMAFIPPGLDQVLIGSIERSRHPDLKTVFLMGATEKQFPIPVISDSIFSDDDRRAAEGADFRLAPATDGALASSQYLAYIAFTRPSKRLYITYPSADDKGSAVLASHFISEFVSLFSDLKEKSVIDEKEDLNTIYTKSELADILCERLGRDVYSAGDNAELAGLLKDMRSDEQLAVMGNEVHSAINYDNAAMLDESVINDCYEKNLSFSATRLSSFATCPYQHFAEYLLELKERKEFEFEPLDIGNFYHIVLDMLFRSLTSAGKNFNTVGYSELLRLLNEQIEILIGKDSFLANFAGRRDYNRFIIRSAGNTLENFVIAVAQMVRAGSLRPYISEISFGRSRHSKNDKESEDNLGLYEIALPGDHCLSLTGKIDRLDVADFDGRRIAVVFDYKRTKKSFDWTKFYAGLDMQLPIYMLAIRNTSGKGRLETAGAFYLTVEAGFAKSGFIPASDAEKKFLYKASGLFNGDYYQLLDDTNSNRYYNFFVTKEGNQYGRDSTSGALRPDEYKNILNFTKRKIIELAGQILSGKINIQPYRISTNSPCELCKYKSVCRFDWQVNSYNYLEKLNKLKVLERVMNING